MYFQFIPNYFQIWCYHLCVLYFCLQMFCFAFDIQLFLMIFSIDILFVLYMCSFWQNNIFTYVNKQACLWCETDFLYLHTSWPVIMSIYILLVVVGCYGVLDVEVGVNRCWCWNLFTALLHLILVNIYVLSGVLCSQLVIIKYLYSKSSRRSFHIIIPITLYNKKLKWLNCVLYGNFWDKLWLIILI